MTHLILDSAFNLNRSKKLQPFLRKWGEDLIPIRWILPLIYLPGLNQKMVPFRVKSNSPFRKKPFHSNVAKFSEWLVVTVPGYRGRLLSSPVSQIDEKFWKRFKRPDVEK